MSPVIWKVVYLMAVMALQGCAANSITKTPEAAVDKFTGYHSTQLKPALSTNQRKLVWEPTPIENLEDEGPMGKAIDRLNRRYRYDNAVTVETNIMDPVRFIQSLLKLARDITVKYMEMSLPHLGPIEKSTLNRLVYDSYKNVIGSPDNIMRR